MLDSHKLLTDNLELDPDLETFLKEGKWSTCTNYVTVSIIGAQGTGKSTLMNSIFGTKFAKKNKCQLMKTNDEETIRKTVCADLSIIEEAEDKYILLINSEGIWGRQRLEDSNEDTYNQLVFEMQLTSFLLSAVDVLLVNIMANQIGHVVASWQKLVHDIMEINTRYIQKDGARKKTIIYVIRDFDEEEYDEDELKDIIKGFFEESNEREKEYKEYDRKFVSKSIEKKQFEKFQQYKIEFEFIWSFKVKNDFLAKSENIKSKIWKYFKKDSKLPKIGSLKSNLKASLKSIIKYYSYSADQLKMLYLEMEKKQIEDWDYAQEEIKKNSDLKQLYKGKDLIEKDWAELYKNKMETGHHSHGVFLKNMEDLSKKASELLKKKERTLYDNEINQLDDYNINKVQSEILSSDQLYKPKDLKNMKLKQIKEYISYIKSNKHEFNSHHYSKFDELEETIDQNIQNYTNFLKIIDFIRQNSIKCFIKYVDKELNNEKAIFSKFDENYIVAYWNSLKRYIWEVNEYVNKNNSILIMIGQKSNNQGIDKNFIKEMFDKLKNEVNIETGKLLIKTKNKIKENFKEKWIKISIDFYQEILKKIENKFNKYDQNKIEAESIRCIEEIMNNIDNYWCISVPSFTSKAQTRLIDDSEFLDDVKTEIKNTWSTKLNDLRIKIEREK